MPYANPDALVSTEWLAAHLSAPDLRVIDATWYHPRTGKKARPDYDAGHIPGAVYFDIDDIADTSRSLPHMLPDATKFASRVRHLGRGNGNRMVVYDRAGGGAAAARVWWTFHVFGHTDIALLDGGWAKWVAEGRPVEDMPPTPRERHFAARVNQTLVRDKAQMLANLATDKEQVIDARPRDRFAGKADEPWPHIKVGHIPGSFNLPWGDLLDPKAQTFLPAETLAARFASAGLDPAKPVIASCGSGVTASVLAFGLHLVGWRDVAVYDGSWAEWGLHTELPAATGPT